MPLIRCLLVTQVLVFRGLACVSPESDIWVGSGCVSGFSSCQWSTVPRVGIFSPFSLSTNERFHFLSIVHAAACRAPSPHHIAKFTPSITKSVNLSFVPPSPRLPRPAGRPFFILRYVLVVVVVDMREISRWDRIVISVVGICPRRRKVPFARSCLSVCQLATFCRAAAPLLTVLSVPSWDDSRSSLSAQTSCICEAASESRVFFLLPTHVCCCYVGINPSFLQLRADGQRSPLAHARI